MKTLVLLLTITLVASASVDLRKHNEVIDDERPHRCCLPKTLQMNVGGSEAFEITGTSTHGLVKFIAQYGMKSEEGIAATRVVNPETFQEAMRFVMDYSKHILYNITGSSCVKHKLEGSLPDMCIPESAKFLASFYFGGGRSTLRVYSWQIKNSTLNLDETITLTRECYPVASEAAIAMGTVRAFVTSGYTDLKTRIEDPSLFEIPESCETAVVLDSINHEYLPKSFFTRF